MKHTIFALLLLAPGFANAASLTFQSLSCTDPVVADKAPIYFEVSQLSPAGPYSTRFDFGNIVAADASGTPQKDGTVLGGVVSSNTLDGDTLTLKGTFNTTLTVNVKTGAGTVSGLLKYDPATGDAVDVARIENHPITCTIQR